MKVWPWLEPREINQLWREPEEEEDAALLIRSGMLKVMIFKSAASESAGVVQHIQEMNCRELGTFCVLSIMRANSVPGVLSAVHLKNTKMALEPSRSLGLKI